MEEETSARRVVVGVDGSPASERALRWAVREAVDRGDSLDVVHAWSVPISVYPYGELYTDPVPLEREGHRVLDQAVTSFTGVGSASPELRPLLIEGNAATLLRAAQGAELLVAGSRGHGGFVGLLVGSRKR